MEVKLEKGKLKSAIVSYNTRLCLDSTNVRSLELIKIRNFMFDEYEREVVDYVTQKTNKEADLDYFKDINETDLNDYDEVYIYNCGLNVFGGVFKWAAIQTFKQLLSYKGKLYYILSDPKMPCQNFGEFIKSKMEKHNDEVPIAEEGMHSDLTYEDIDTWNNEVWPNIITAFYGFDYEHFYDVYMQNKRNQKVPFALSEKHDWCLFPLQEYFGSKLLKDDWINYPLEDRKYDLVYFGKNRGTDRNKVIKLLYSNNDLNKFFIGCEGTDFNCKENTTSIGSVQREDLFPTIARNSYCTIIVGDQLHYNNYRTFRFFEALLLDVVAFIYYKYDENKQLIHNKELQDFIYVETPEELVEKVNKVKSDKELFNRIVKLERQEILEQFGKFSNITSINEVEVETSDTKGILGYKPAKKTTTTTKTKSITTPTDGTITITLNSSETLKLLTKLLEDAGLSDFSVTYNTNTSKETTHENEVIVQKTNNENKSASKLW